MPTKSVIRSISHFVPPRVVTNDDLEKRMDTSDEWIRERTGIRQRRFVDVGVSASALAIQASKQALEQARLSPADIDYIIAATTTPDYYFPGIGTLMQHRMGFKPLPALDIRAQCSGFVYGLSVADALIRSGGAKRVLLACSEVLSVGLNLSSAGRETAVLFGDAAAATILESENCNELPGAKNKERGVIDSILRGDGGGAECLMLRSPGTATPGFLSAKDIEEGRTHPYMDGKAIFKQAITSMCEVAQEIMARHKITSSDIDLLVCHQANLRINEMVREKLGVPPERTFNNIEFYGNTSAASIPLCLSEASKQGKLNEGFLVLTVSFGAGLTWGANLLRW